MKNEVLLTILVLIVITVLTTPTVSYLLDFDSWYHYRLAEYTFEQGTRPSFDPLSNTGENIIYPPLLHYLIAIPAHLPGLNVMLVSQFYPPLAAILALAFVFLFAREIFDERIAILAALFVSVLPIFKATTSFGLSDHDALDYVFIMSTFFFFVKAIKKHERILPISSASFALGDAGFVEVPVERPKVIEKREENKLLYYALAGVSTGLFALTWLGFPMLIVLISAFISLLSISNQYFKLLDKDMVIGFLIMSIAFGVIASLWYGIQIIPFISVMLFSTMLSYVALRLENNGKSMLILVAILVICSVPLLLLFKSSIVDVGLTYLSLKDKDISLGYVAELKTPTTYDVYQHYGTQILLFIFGLAIFATFPKKLNRETLFFIISFFILVLLASAAIRFLQYAGFFVSIFSAYLLTKLSDIISASLKKDAFIPVMLLSALLLFPPPIFHSSVSNDWYNALQWLKANSGESDVVMNWWDYSPWVNGIAGRKTVVNNQPLNRLYDQVTFFATNDWNNAKEILKKYNVSYVIVSRGYLAKMYTLSTLINETIEFNTASPSRIGGLYSATFGTGFKTYYDSNLNVAWDEYPNGKKVYYKEIGLFDQQTYKNQYVKAGITGVEFNEDYLFMFSDLFIRIPAQTKDRVFFNLMYTNSTMPYLELVKDAGEVRVYKVV